MGNSKSVKKTVPEAVVFDKKTEKVSIKADASGISEAHSRTCLTRQYEDQSYSVKSDDEMTTEEEQGIFLSRSTTHLLIQREATGSSGYASLGNGLSLTSETGRLLMKDVNESTRRGLKKKDVLLLRRSFRFMKKEIEPDPIVDYFIRDEYMSEDEREKIQMSGTRRDQVDALLCMLVRLQEEAFGNFCDYLQETGYGYVKEYILNKTNSEIEKTTLENIADSIQRNKSILIDQLEPDTMAEYLVKYDVISFEEYEKLRDKSRVRSEKAEQLINLVLAYQPESFDVFIYALKKSKGEYCVDIFANGSAKFEGTGAAAESSSKIKEIKVTCRESRKLLKGGIDRLDLKLELNDNNVELEVVEELNSCTVKLAINEELFHKELVYTRSGCGSIIISLRALSHDRRRGAKAEFTVSTISEVLNVVLKYSQTLQRCAGQTFDVTLVTYHATEKRIMNARKTCNPKDTIKRNLALLEEELDALTLMKDTRVHKIFSEEEVSEILQNDNPRRRERTKRMLSKLLEKDSDAVATFISVLKHKKRNLVLEHLVVKEGASLRKTAMCNVETVSRIIPHISPLTVEKECIEMGIIGKDDFLKIRSREARIKAVFQNLMAKTDEEIVRFFQILQWYRQIPRDILSCKPILQVKRRVKTALIHIGQFKIVKERSIQKAIASRKDQQETRPAAVETFISSCSSCESGYVSHWSLDSVGHEKRSPRRTTTSPLVTNGTPDITPHNDNITQTNPTEKWNANISSSLKSMDCYESGRRKMTDTVHTNEHIDVTRKETKTYISRSSRKITVTPATEEKRDTL